MATHRLPIFNSGTLPDTSGDVFFETYATKATNAVWSRMVAIFNDTSTRIGMHGGFSVPKNYIDTANLVVVWTSTATTGDVVWDFEYRSVGGNDAESLDQTGNQEASLTVTDASPTTINYRLEATIALTDTNFSVDDEVEFQLFRDGTGSPATDDMAAAAIVFSIFFEYNDA